MKTEYFKIYLEELTSLSDSIHECWVNSWNSEEQQIDIAKFKNSIRSHGDYVRKKSIIKKKEPKISLKSKVHLNVLLLANKIVGNGGFGIEDLDTGGTDGNDDFSEVVLMEVQNNLFNLNNIADKIAYANILLRQINQIDLYNQQNDYWDETVNYPELFNYLQDHDFLINKDNPDNDINSCVFSYGNDLQVKFVKHLFFISEFIELFSCFDIDIFLLAEKAELRILLLTFDDSKISYHLKPYIELKNIECQITKEQELKYNFTINSTLYDPDKIYTICNRTIFQCDKDTFESWLVNRVGSVTKIKWLDTKHGCKAQLRAFINEITNDKLEPRFVNLIFGTKITNNIRPGVLTIKMSNLLKQCKV